MTGSIWPQTDDDLSVSTLGRALALSHQTNYVEWGCGLNADFQQNTVDIGDGHCIIRDNNDARHVYPDGTSGLSLPVSAGVNYLYVDADFADDTADAVTLVALANDSPPSSSSLKIGEVDTAADTTTPLNRGAPLDLGDFDAATLGGNGPGYYAASADPRFTGTPLVTGVASQIQLGEEGQGGPHGFIFANNENEDFGFIGFRTSPDTLTFENYTTGTKILEAPIDGSTPPKILGEEIQTISSGTNEATVYVGDTAPQNPNDGDVWIDTS